MQTPVSIDIEAALVTDLTAIYSDGDIEDIVFSATPFPPELGDIDNAQTRVCISRVGGTKTALVVDTSGVAVDVYAQTWGEALEQANVLAGVIISLPIRSGLSAQYYTAQIDTAPYELPDPSNPIHPRVRMLVSIRTRSSIIEL